MPTATDEKLGADLADFRVEVEKRFGSVEKDIEGFRKEVKTDLRWIKAIGVGLLLTAFSFAGWVISDMATLKAEVRQQGGRLDEMKKQLEQQGGRLDKIEKLGDKIDHLSEIINRSQGRFERNAAPTPKGGQ